MSTSVFDSFLCSVSPLSSHPPPKLSNPVRTMTAEKNKQESCFLFVKDVSLSMSLLHFFFSGGRGGSGWEKNGGFVHTIVSTGILWAHSGSSTDSSEKGVSLLIKLFILFFLTFSRIFLSSGLQLWKRGK